MANVVTVSGMFGSGHTYFSNSPVVIKISGLEWSKPGEAVTSPFTIVRVYVVYMGNRVGDFHEDTGGQKTATFDISSALRVIWAKADFSGEVSDAQDAADGGAPERRTRTYRSYSLEIFTEYLDSTDGEYVITQCEDQHGNKTIPGGQCLIGGMTEWERSSTTTAERDVSALENTNPRNGDASTKPSNTPERVGKNSITSWVDINSGGTQSVFYPASAPTESDSYSVHAPIVLRDTQEYVDFLFLNRRGAIETCSGLTKEAMSIDLEIKQYSRLEQPSFRPSRSLMAIGSDGRRSWQMSSGYVPREWADWWAMEFLGGKNKQWWMKYKGIYVPVIVEPEKQNTSIYDRTKQDMPHVDFTVTLALEG